jgi:hypothetical protein
LVGRRRGHRAACFTCSKDWTAPKGAGAHDPGTSSWPLRNVPADPVCELLSLIHTEKGLAQMRAQQKTFAEMSVENGVNGIVTPLHPGAERFRCEQGVLESSEGTRQNPDFGLRARK